jgi:hypothetical protein
MLAGSAVASVTRLKVEVNDALLESLIRSAGTPSRATPSNRPQRLLAASRSAGSCEERHRTQLATRARRINGGTNHVCGYIRSHWPICPGCHDVAMSNQG